MDSAESSEFSTSSRVVVYSDFPGLSNPAMFLFSAKNSAGDFCLRALGGGLRGVLDWRFFGFLGSSGLEKLSSLSMAMGEGIEGGEIDLGV